MRCISLHSHSLTICTDANDDSAGHRQAQAPVFCRGKRDRCRAAHGDAAQEEAQGGVHLVSHPAPWPRSGGGGKGGAGGRGFGEWGCNVADADAAGLCQRGMCALVLLVVGGVRHSE